MTNPDKPAFPAIAHSAAAEVCEFGLTKRELFAAMAFQSLRQKDMHCTSKAIAELAVKDADALIARLNQ